jgi:hypothetical protein
MTRGSTAAVGARRSGDRRRRSGKHWPSIQTTSRPPRNCSASRLTRGGCRTATTLPAGWRPDVPTAEKATTRSPTSFATAACWTIPLARATRRSPATRPIQSSGSARRRSFNSGDTIGHLTSSVSTPAPSGRGWSRDGSTSGWAVETMRASSIASSPRATRPGWCPRVSTASLRAVSQAPSGPARTG